MAEKESNDEASAFADRIIGEASVVDSEKDAIRQAVGDAYAKIGVSAMPSCPGPEGILYDFCWGMRVYIPDSPQRRYRVQFWDVEDERLCYDGVIENASWIQSVKHYYRQYYLRISDAGTNDVLFEHKMDLRGQVVLFYFPVDTIGDTLAWFRSVEVFQQRHNCLAYVAVAPHMRKILEKAHQNMRFIEREQARTIRPYASYMFGVSYDDDWSSKQNDFRTVPLTWRGADILGLDPHECRLQEIPPRIDYDRDAPSQIEGRYVAISSMASGGCKLWLNPNGWNKVIKYLKHYGYRVIDIDGRFGTGTGFVHQFIPRDAEDFTGEGEGKTLADRARLIHHADFFIGLGSGLSWLAWCVGRPVVLISGFSAPWCEFYTPYRVINPKVCHGCFNDVRHTFDPHDCFWCPKHKNTPRQLECSTQITPEQVINAIRRIPIFRQKVDIFNDSRNAAPPETSQASPTFSSPTGASGGAVVSVPSTSDEEAGKPKTLVWKVRNGGIADAEPEPKDGGLRPGQAGAAQVIDMIQRRIDEGAAKREAESASKDTSGIGAKGKRKRTVK